MDKTDQLQFATAEILVGNKLIVDFPIEIGQTYIKLNSYGVVPVAHIQHLKIKQHRNQTITAKNLQDWPIVPAAKARPDRRTLKEQKLAAKRAERRERRLVKRLSALSADQK